MGTEQKKKKKFEKKIQNGRLKKTTFFKIANSQYFFLKILWIRCWVSRIDCCEGHRCGSTYMAVRLSDISPKTGKKCIFCVFRPFLSLCRTASRPYRLSHIAALRINQFYYPKDRSIKFSQKNIENWRSPENDFCLVFWFLVFGYWVVQKKKKNSQWKTPRRFIWDSIYFFTMDGFFRILKKAVSELMCTRLYVSN